MSQALLQLQRRLGVHGLLAFGVVLVSLSILLYPLIAALLLLPAVLYFLLSGKHIKQVSFLLSLFIQLQALISNLGTLYLPAVVVIVQRADDLLAVIMFGVVLLAKCLRPDAVKVFGTPLDIPLLWFVLYGFCSGFINQTPPHITALGLQDMLGSFLFFYIFRALRLDRQQLLRFGKILFVICVFLAFTAFIEEFLPYALLQKFGIGTEDYRLGIRRVTSLTTNPNRLASLLYPCLMFLFITRKQISLKPLVVFVLGAAFLMSFSRQYWLAVFFSVCFLAWRFRGALPKRRMLAFALVATFFIGLLGLLGSIGGLPSHKNALVPPSGDKYFRMYALMKSFQILADHPFLGVGPGRFGGFVSRLFPSPVYPEYNFQWRSENAAQIDMYWPQVWTEVGVIGLLFYAWALVAVYRCLRRMYDHYRERDPALAEMTLTAVAMFFGVIIASFGSPAFSSAYASMNFFALAGTLQGLYEADRDKFKLIKGEA